MLSHHQRILLISSPCCVNFIWLLQHLVLVQQEDVWRNSKLVWQDVTVCMLVGKYLQLQPYEIVFSYTLASWRCMFWKFSKTTPRYRRCYICDCHTGSIWEQTVQYDQLDLDAQQHKYSYNIFVPSLYLQVTTHLDPVCFFCMHEDPFSNFLFLIVLLLWEFVKYVFLKKVVTVLSLGMLHTVEDADTLEKVDQGEEISLCGLWYYQTTETHTHTLWVSLFVRHLHRKCVLCNIVYCWLLRWPIWTPHTCF